MPAAGRRRRPNTGRARPEQPALILASASPRRAGLLAQAGIRCQVVPARLPEEPHRHLTPRELCVRNAAAKARQISAAHPRAVVLGADTEVALDHTVLGKPRSRQEAARFLARLAGRAHQVITAVCLRRTVPRRERVFIVVTHVVFHPLTPRQIADYLRKVNPLDKAGAYAIQEHGERLVERIEGSLTNVIGLPVARVRAELERFLAG